MWSANSLFKKTMPHFKAAHLDHLAKDSFTYPSESETESDKRKVAAKLHFGRSRSALTNGETVNSYSNHREKWVGASQSCDVDGKSELPAASKLVSIP